MSALNRKLLRDLWALKGQAVAIALVIASGIATFIMALSTLDSLIQTQTAFYRDYRFADVFASLKRAPEAVRSRLESIEGVRQVETRVVTGASLDIEGFGDPVTALIVSLPDSGQSTLNRIYIRRGRTVEAGRDDEVVIGEPFADAHGFQPGDRLRATIRGRRRTLRIVGVALSPEFVYQMQPGALIPDFRTYGVLWMARKPLESAAEMKGGFNDVSFQISPGTNADTVIARADEVLARYGGLGAIARRDQLSNRYLSEEFKQLRQMATMFPVIFLGVAAFLLNVVVSRLITTQREQLALLKAFGYSTADVAIHYTKLVVLVVALGVALGIGAGIWTAKGMVDLYMEYYRFPFMIYVLKPSVVAAATLITLAAALAGTLFSVLKAARIPPAEAMQPAAPLTFRRTLIERMGFTQRLAQPTRMIFRNIGRRPVKALLTLVGIAFGCGIVVIGGFYRDCIDYMVAIQFRYAQQDDITVTFIEPTPERAMYSLRQTPGVGIVEPFRAVAAQLRFEHRIYRGAVRGIPEGNSLYRLLDTKLQPVALPPDGVILTDFLADMLGIRAGDTLTVEVLEGRRPVLEVPVAGIVQEFIGVSAYMRLDALNRLMREGQAISGVYLTTSREARPRILDELKEIPRVAGAAVRENTLQNFYETLARQMLVFIFINTLMATTVAFGVVYNSIRIALSERSRELASLRVLGFTLGEISYILLGELALLTLAAIPLGCFIGYALSAIMVKNLETELFRVPAIIFPATYSFAATVVLVAALLSGLAAARKLARLDLVAVLKARE
jgi:putative ABC transport system permease protein